MKKRHAVPLLLTSHGKKLEKQSLYSLTENRYKTISHPVLKGKRILGSDYGWLVLKDMTPYNLCIWNPESNEKIQLPHLHKAYDYNTCVLSKPPTDPDCLVVFQDICFTKYAVCRISDDEFVKVTDQSLVAVSSFGDDVYGIIQDDAYYKLVTIHLVGKTVELKPLLINGEPHLEVPELRRRWVRWINNYLIQLSGGSGEFFLVIKLISKVSTHVDCNLEFRVFRLDVNELVCDCVEVENLDGYTIFLGSTGDAFCCTSDGTGIKPNSIYYTEICGRVVYVYDMDDRTSTPLLPCPIAGRHMSVNYWVDLPNILCLV
ncbi:hypothetical protein CASFOL_015815 [Castilleja foliolosa]|uniref:KIB1-4 beta-propeller domain-containing protein n=1 Tax=Castilleja foliolosa TaxID=1961234 RepID=A0ABD3DIM4_9LAMI